MKQTLSNYRGSTGQLSDTASFDDEDLFSRFFLLFCFASAKTKPAKRELKCGTGKKKGLTFFVFLISNLQMLIVYSSFFKTINKDEIT